MKNDGKMFFSYQILTYYDFVEYWRSSDQEKKPRNLMIFFDKEMDITNFGVTHPRKKSVKGIPHSRNIYRSQVFKIEKRMKMIFKQLI